MPWKPVDPAASIRYRRQRQAAQAIRPRGQNLPYKSRTWANLRSIKLSVHPICEVCDASLAHEVHHLNSDPWDNRWENLLSACKPCHSTTTIFQSGVSLRRSGISIAAETRAGVTSIEKGMKAMSRGERSAQPRLTVLGNAGAAAEAANGGELLGCLEPPPVLVDEIAISTWNDAVLSLHPDGKISGLQQTLLVGYCMALSKALRAEEILSREGPYYMAANTNGLVVRRRHPAVHDAEKSWHAVRQFSRQLGIPAALKTAPGPVSERRAIFK